eukprot:GHVR01050985.1.p1 GENE.GHVR01050985.1~~GHVR01050985.1.p1  ORF type:complete len:107 (+),score=3.70 GHVR01050985.1:3343-3663(+)
MLIDRLEVTNFKSYGEHQIVGPFHHHFSCIVGPNGNGKSNIIDAMLFVFGFKSSKLRQDSLSSLIHRSAFSEPDFCKVAVVFKDNSMEIKISRTVKKNGNNFYEYN